MQELNLPEESSSKNWWKKYGYLGFWFFLIKGILWILGFILIYFFGIDIFGGIRESILNFF